MTNIDPSRWALQIHVDLLVQGSPSLSFLCGGCQHHCHPNDDKISGWVYNIAVLYGGYDTVRFDGMQAKLCCKVGRYSELAERRPKNSKTFC